MMIYITLIYISQLKHKFYIVSSPCLHACVIVWYTFPTPQQLEAAMTVGMRAISLFLDLKHFFRIELETSVSFLEDECYKKYSKAGKSFYYSQVASTVRWLTTASSSELMNRLSAINVSTSTDVLSEAEQTLTPPALDPCTKDTNNEHSSNARSEISPCVVPMESSSFNNKLPQIPSFSEFVNSRKAKGDQLNDTKTHSLRVEKKMRIQ